MRCIGIVTILLLFYSCSNVCHKKMSRTLVEIDKDDLVCQCNDLKIDTLIGHKLYLRDNDSSRYLIGQILTKSNKKGLYQYVKVSPSTRVNNYIYYDGINIHDLDKINLPEYSDSLDKLGFDKNEIEKIMLIIQKNLSKPPENNSDVF